MASWKKVLHESSPTGDFPSGVALANLGGGSGSTFLKKDGSWATPTDTTYSNSSWTITSLSGFNSSTANYLRGDGSWVTPPDNNTTYSNSSWTITSLSGFNSSTSNYLRGDGSWVTPPDTNTQNTYVAGTGLSLSTLTFSLDSGAALTNLGGGSGSTFLKKDGSWATPTDTDTNTTYTFTAYDNAPASGIVFTKSTGGATTIEFEDGDLSYAIDGTVITASLTNNSVDSAEIASGAVGASELDVSGNGTSSQYLRSDGDGTMTWATPTDTNTQNTYTAGSGLDVSSYEFSVEADLRDGITHIGTDSGDYIGWTLNTHTDFYVNGNNEFRMEADGDFHADGDVIAASTTVASDKRLKTDIVQLEGNLDNVMSLEPVRFDWKLKNKGEDIGLIAQDVQRIVPEVVKEVEAIGKTKKFLKDDTMLTVDYSKLVPVLVGAIQELKAEIDDLKRLK